MNLHALAGLIHVSWEDKTDGSDRLDRYFRKFNALTKSVPVMGNGGEC